MSFTFTENHSHHVRILVSTAVAQKLGDPGAGLVSVVTLPAVLALRPVGQAPPGWSLAL